VERKKQTAHRVSNITELDDKNLYLIVKNHGFPLHLLFALYKIGPGLSRLHPAAQSWHPFATSKSIETVWFSYVIVATSSSAQGGGGSFKKGNL